MKTLDDITIGEISTFLSGKIAEERNISRTVAKKLLANALEYNVVVAAINEQIDYILGD